MGGEARYKIQDTRYKIQDTVARGRAPSPEAREPACMCNASGLTSRPPPIGVMQRRPCPPSCATGGWRSAWRARCGRHPYESRAHACLYPPSPWGPANNALPPWGDSRNNYPCRIHGIENLVSCILYLATAMAILPTMSGTLDKMSGTLDTPILRGNVYRCIL